MARCWLVKAVVRQCRWAPGRGAYQPGAQGQAGYKVPWHHPEPERWCQAAHKQKPWAKPRSCLCCVTKRGKGSSQSGTCRWAADVVELQNIGHLYSLELSILWSEATRGAAAVPWTAGDGVWESGPTEQRLPHSCWVQHWSWWVFCFKSFETTIHFSSQPSINQILGASLCLWCRWVGGAGGHNRAKSRRSRGGYGRGGPVPGPHCS